ncbi:unnamed protein product [Paramecium pentaurelia]|uniref:Uncharacterized protein n=1 Tax=Paramecium pentaurelia TaxID=43138 RepID=A0A8S1WMC1_9CILI|nr:unnamed protein product [Paramecium pentaurelia]
MDLLISYLGTSNWIRCIILNNDEDLFISILRQRKEWICQQIITDHSSDVHQLSLNEKQIQGISWESHKLISLIEQSESDNI